MLLALLLVATPAELKDAFQQLAPKGIELVQATENKGEIALTGKGPDDMSVAELMRALRPLMRTADGPARVLERPSADGLKVELLVGRRPLDLMVKDAPPYDVKLLRAKQQKGFVTFEIRLK